MKTVLDFGDQNGAGDGPTDHSHENPYATDAISKGLHLQLKSIQGVYSEYAMALFEEHFQVEQPGDAAAPNEEYDMCQDMWLT